MSSVQNPNGVHLVGDFTGNSGLCQAGRNLLEALKHADVPLDVTDLPLSLESRCSDWLRESGVKAPPDNGIILVAWSPEAYPHLLRMLGPRFFEGRRVIGSWFWETEMLDACHRAGFSFCDEIWVATDFMKRVFERESTVPVRKFPSYQPLIPKPRCEFEHPAIHPNQFVFLFMFDLRSTLERKNPEGVIEAFCRAYPAPDPTNPLCVLKVSGVTDHNAIQLLRLKLQARHRPDILIIDEWLTTDQRNALLWRADCYVSLHRAEGLGLTLMEAMACGKPCIATDYSGTTDFVRVENAWLIPYRLAEVGPNVAPYPTHHQWAEPDLDAAAAAIREAAQNKDVLLQKGQSARRMIAEEFSLERCASTIRSLLASGAEGERPHKTYRLEEFLPQDAFSITSARLKELRALEEESKALLLAVKKLEKLNPELKALVDRIFKMVRRQRKSNFEIVRYLRDFAERDKAWKQAVEKDILLLGQIISNLPEKN